ncbi:MAG TPA: hypothetical protein GXX46_10520 [Peptococcaceae bacterium]|nr:hypothetical protein [Peptococcaceae bacterium]
MDTVINNVLQAFVVYNGIIGMSATLILALIILGLVKTVKKSVKEITQPYVVLYLTKLQTDESVNYLVLENFGQRAALNIAVDINPELEIEYPKGSPFSLFIEHRISVLAPAQRIMTALPPGDYMEKRYDCIITYQDDKKELYTRKQILDFSYLKRLLFAPSPQNRIAKNLEKISQYLEQQ